MNEIAKVITEMDSREIAELTGKRHADVMRDIKIQFEAQEIAERRFASGYLDANNQQRPCFLLDKEQVMCLVTGYSIPLRMRVIKRLNELEAKQPQLPTTYIQALESLIASEKQKEVLLLENTVLKPKAEYFDKIVERNLLTNFRDTAKEFGVKQKVFITWLLENGFIYRDRAKKIKPYADHVAKGLFEIKDWAGSSKAGVQTMITPKGKETIRLLLL